MNRNEWLLLLVTLPGPTKTARMRLWRALRASGAEALRDGAYVLPKSSAAEAQFGARSTEVIAGGGSAELIAFGSRDPEQEARLIALFDRGPEHARLIVQAQATKACLNADTQGEEAQRRLSGLRREAAALARIDFFPGPAADQLEEALTDVEIALAARTGSDEPQTRRGGIVRRDKTRYQGRRWATRAHLWIDRVASAWLIRRFIDHDARFLWLRTPQDCPETAVGFDFDEAEFTHVGARVTFEVLLVSFGLDQDAALVRLGNVVHALDVGGAPVPEAAGFAAIMAGYRARNLDDDTLLAEASGLLDAFYAGFQQGEAASP